VPTLSKYDIIILLHNSILFKHQIGNKVLHISPEGVVYMADADLRVQKTRSQIRASLIDLLKDYKFDEITVKMIIEKADVNRSTFYRNYSDKYDLFDRVVADILEECKESVDIRFIDISELKEPIFRGILHKCLTFFYNNRREYLILWNADTPVSLYAVMCSYMEEALYDHLIEHNFSMIDPKVIELYSKLFINMTMLTTRWWLENTRVKSIDELISIMSNNVEKGLLHTIKELIK